jgi:cytochrome c553
MKQKSLNAKKTLPIFLFVLAVFLIIGVHVLNPTPASGQQTPGVYTMKTPPASMDKLYPPQSPMPVWLPEMFKLSSFYMSVGNDARQGDWANAQQGFDNLKAQFIKLSGLVPEWKHYFNMDLVNALGQALAKKDPKAIGGASQKLGNAVCGRCHGENRPAVWFHYGFKDFSKIMVEDPLSKKKVPLMTYMFMLAGPFDGIEIDFHQGQKENALKNFGAFSARAKALKTGVCDQCHNPKKERKYFASSEVMGMIDSLGAELSKSNPAPERVEHLFQEVGMEMCYECHVVHIPAATVQRAWKPKTQ